MTNHQLGILSLVYCLTQYAIHGDARIFFLGLSVSLLAPFIPKR